MARELKVYDFVCPFCNKEYYTYIEATKLKDVYSREMLIEDIFPNYPTEYRKIFVSRVCNNCQREENDELDITRLYTIPYNSSPNEDAQLYSRINTLIDESN